MPGAELELRAPSLLRNLLFSSVVFARRTAVPAQDALDADHISVAVLLRAHGGILGPSGDASLLEKLQGPDVPTVYQVKKLINKLMRQQVI